jgi:hypothetical protein
MDEDVTAAPFIAVIFAIIMVLLPVRTLIYKYWMKIENQGGDEDETYSSQIEQFPDDYDSSNPLTKRQGNERINKLKIDKLKEEQDEANPNKNQGAIL